MKYSMNIKQNVRINNFQFQEVSIGVYDVEPGQDVGELLDEDVERTFKALSKKVRAKSEQVKQESEAELIRQGQQEEHL